MALIALVDEGPDNDKHNVDAIDGLIVPAVSRI